MDIYITPLTSHQLKAFKSSKGPASKASQSFCSLGHTAVEMTTSDSNGYENKSDINEWMMFINEKAKNIHVHNVKDLEGTNSVPVSLQVLQKE